MPTFGPDSVNDAARAGARAGDPRTRRPRQEPPERRDVVDRQRARLQRRGAREYFEPLATLTRELDPTRPVTFVNVMLATSSRTDRRPVRRDLPEPLLRLVRRHRRPRGRRGAPRGRAPRLGGEVRQADHHDRVRRRHRRGPALRLRPAVDRGVPGRLPRHEPPRVRPHRLRSSASRCGTSRTSRRRTASSASTATRRASSRATASPRPPLTRCAPAGPASASRPATTT